MTKLTNTWLYNCPTLCPFPCIKYVPALLFQHTQCSHFKEQTLYSFFPRQTKQTEKKTDKVGQRYRRWFRKHMYYIVMSFPLLVTAFDQTHVICHHTSFTTRWNITTIIRLWTNLSLNAKTIHYHRITERQVQYNKK